MSLFLISAAKRLNVEVFADFKDGDIFLCCISVISLVLTLEVWIRPCSCHTILSNLNMNGFGIFN